MFLCVMQPESWCFASKFTSCSLWKLLVDALVGAAGTGSCSYSSERRNFSCHRKSRAQGYIYKTHFIFFLAFKKLRYNLHTLRCTHFKCIQGWVLVNLYNCMCLSFLISFSLASIVSDPEVHLCQSPHPFPTQDTAGLFSVSLVLLFLEISNKWNHTIYCLDIWLLSCSTVSLRFIHVLAYNSNSLLFIAEWYFIVWMYYLLKKYIPPLIDTWIVSSLGCSEHNC